MPRGQLVVRETTLLKNAEVRAQKRWEIEHQEGRSRGHPIQRPVWLAVRLARLANEGMPAAFNLSLNIAGIAQNYLGQNWPVVVSGRTTLGPLRGG